MAEKEAVPVPSVDAGASTPINIPGGEAAIQAVQPHTDLSMMGMFMQADMIVKSVIIALLLASFWCWTIIINRTFQFRGARKKMESFENEIWHVESLEDKYEEIKHTADNPLARVFVSGMYEWIKSMAKSQAQQAVAASSQSIKTIAQVRASQTLKAGIKERIFHAMDTARNREVSNLEKGLSFLASVGSVAPFVGLFGTVWGIMNSFQSIALTKNTTLAVVAPGIAEALFATAVGLFAAIPAVIFYNKLANNVAVFTDKIDDFSSELGVVMARELDE